MAMTDPSAQAIALQEAASRYLASLAPQERQQAQPEVHRFVRWYGADRRVGELRGHDVSAYADTLGSSVADAAQRLEVVRSFLAFARKQGFTATNLSTHLRPRKVTPAPASAGATAQRRQVHLTAEGRAALKEELERLKAMRVRIAQDLQRAMADKDFRENAPLDAAREQQGYVEGRIREIEATLDQAVIISQERPSGASAGVGSTLVLRNLESGAEVRYTLVQPGEVHPGQGRISVESPVGKALLGRRVGEGIEVSAPAGVLRFRIERVEG